MMPNKPSPQTDDPVRDHAFDGITEYDRRLPNWWLMTFYATIVFAIIYWLVVQQSPVSSDEQVLQQDLARIEAARLASSGAPLDDTSLAAMSRNPVFVEAGRATFKTTCLSCHGEKLLGGVGPNLVDATWLHGSRPKEVFATVNNGVLVKGMPAWGPVLGTKRTSEVVAFVLSQQPVAAVTP